MEKIIKTIIIPETNITIQELYDIYWEDKYPGYKQHYQLQFGDELLPYNCFDLDEALLATSVWNITKDRLDTVSIMKLLHKMLGLNLRKLNEIIKIDGDLATDGEIIDIIFKEFNLEQYE